MKKFLSLLLALVICISLVACGGNSSKEEEVVVDPIEEAKSKLSEAYETCCGDLDSKYASLGYDGKSLTIDSNPTDNKYSGDDEDAVRAMVMVNAFLELPSSLNDKISSTRALDGMQSQDCGDYTVTWNYHPNNGMKIIYEVNP